MRKMRMLLIVGVILALATGLGSAEVARERLAILLADFTTEAELTYPSDGEGPFPTVVLIAGSGAADMDFSLYSPFEFGPQGPRLLSAIFRDIADYLSERGFAVLRYNKRYVTGPNQADLMRYYQLTLEDLFNDAAAVVEAAKRHPQVDPERLFVYGWSEGSTIASELAARGADLAGLILHGPVVLSWKESFEFQTFEVGWPYTLRFAEDGYITPATLFQAWQSEGGMVAKSTLGYLIDPEAMAATGGPAVNRALDLDQDGRLEIGVEVTDETLSGIIEANFAPGGYFAMYAPGLAIPTVGEQVDRLDLPVLILQGALDANVPAWAAVRLYHDLVRREHPDVALRLYDDLGHSLGKTQGLFQDNFQPIAEEPLEDLVAWLKERI